MIETACVIALVAISASLLMNLYRLAIGPGARAAQSFGGGSGRLTPCFSI